MGISILVCGVPADAMPEIPAAAEVVQAKCSMEQLMELEKKGYVFDLVYLSDPRLATRAWHLLTRPGGTIAIHKAELSDAQKKEAGLV